MVIYVLTTGWYQYRRIALVTTDVRKVAQYYNNQLKKEDYYVDSDEPTIEIWKNEEWVQDFNGKGVTDKRLVKWISKVARGIE